MKNRLDKHFNYSMCKLCGGLCCQGYAGSYIPKDFKKPITSSFILGLLKTGKFAIDWLEGGESSSIYFLRPRHKGESAIEGSWGGVCVNWTKGKGCSLSEAKRPYQCRMLIPKFKDGEPNCTVRKKDKATKHDCAIAWSPYQAIIDEAIKNYYNSKR